MDTSVDAFERRAAAAEAQLAEVDARLAALERGGVAAPAAGAGAGAGATDAAALLAAMRELRAVMGREQRAAQAVEAERDALRLQVAALEEDKAKLAYRIQHLLRD